jgi:hypothetical protein
MKWANFRDLLPVLTLVLGYMGTQWTDTSRNRRERRAVEAAAHRAFELQTLLELQRAMTEVFGAAQDCGRAAVHGEPTEECYHRYYAAHLELEVLAARVPDPKIRELCSELIDEAHATVTAALKVGTEEAVVAARSKLSLATDALNSAIGETLRALY